EPVKKVEVKVNEDPKAKSYEELLKEASPEVQDQMEAGMQSYKEQKEALINSIINVSIIYTAYSFLLF
ncbi:unnamed protein product, partial [marine sediment metagenome]